MKRLLLLVTVFCGCVDNRSLGPGETIAPPKPPARMRVVESLMPPYGPDYYIIEADGQEYIASSKGGLLKHEPKAERQ